MTKGERDPMQARLHIIWGREVPCKHCISQGEERSHARIAYQKGEKRSSTKVEKYEDHWQREDEMKTRRQDDRGRY